MPDLITAAMIIAMTTGFAVKIAAIQGKLVGRVDVTQRPENKDRRNKESAGDDTTRRR